MAHDHSHHDHADDHPGDKHHHGHDHDQGLKGALRYLRHAPQMWSSEINDAVVDLAAPKAGESVLDIGAGMGAGVRRAVTSGATITAIEPTPFLRQVLSARVKTQFRKSNVRVIDGAAEQLGVADASTDAIWAVNTMHHWVDPTKAAAEIARVLKPGGRVVLVDEDFENPAHPDYETFGKRHGRDSDDDHGDNGHNHDDDHHNDGHSNHGFHMVDTAAMADLLSEAGLVDIEAGERDVAGRPVLAVLAHKPR